MVRQRESWNRGRLLKRLQQVMVVMIVVVVVVTVVVVVMTTSYINTLQEGDE